MSKEVALHRHATMSRGSMTERFVSNSSVLFFAAWGVSVRAALTSHGAVPDHEDTHAFVHLAVYTPQSKRAEIFFPLMAKSA